MRRPLLIAHSSLLIALLASSALAVHPQSWSFSTQKDFAEGSFDNTVVDSYGQLSLGRQLTAIDTDPTAEAITAFAQTHDGSLYVATGRDPKIFRIDPATAKSTPIYKAPKGYSDITAMAADGKGNLLVALAGGEDGGTQKARLIKLTPQDKPVSAIKFENDDVNYIWAIAQSEDGEIYLGTGPHGKVYKLPNAEGGNGRGAQEGAVVLESTADNITALAFDLSHNLIAGTDAKGLVIRIDTKTQKPFILLDAGKVDITAIVPAKDGSLYVTTAKADLTADQPDEPPAEETPTKSKPGKVILEPTEPPADPQGAAPAILTPGIYAAPPQNLPPELKDLINQLQQKSPHKQPPTSNKKPALPHAAKPSAPNNPSPSESSPEESADAAALYRIAPDGSGGGVTTLMQEPDQNYALLLTGNGDDLLIGTGDEAAGAKLFRYHLPDQSLTLLARLKQEQITTLFSDAAGQVFIGTTNMAQVYRLESSLAKTGSFTSQVLDASHAANFGHANAQLLAPLSPGEKITLATRSSNTRDAQGKNAQFWSDWSPELDLAAPVKIPSPAARFLQYRITLTGNGAGAAEANSSTPIATSIKLSYQTENLAPVIKSVTVDNGTAGDDDDSSSDNHPDLTQDIDATPLPAHITWDASDPNNDTLSFRLYYRPFTTPKPGDVIAGSSPHDFENPWSPLAQNLRDNTFEWDTRSLPDGRYQVKVIASDKPDNTPDTAQESARVSAPFTINHTPPTLSELKAVAGGGDANKASLSGEATDALSPVTDIRYQIDSQGDWQPASPSDKLFDSLHEAFTIVTRPLAAGAHRIIVRATDAAGNCSYKAATVTIK